MRLSAQVMAHPKRAEMVEDLLARLDRPVGVTWDEINDRHDTGIRAVMAYDPDATHHLVIQDDVVPCPDLLAGAQRALEHVPDGCPVSLYVGRVRPFRRAVEKAVAEADDASWITMDGVYWGPAIILPVPLIDALAEWYQGPRAKRITNYDRRVSRWFEARKIRCWYTWPSLVEHRGDESLVAGRTGVRRAHRAHQGSALDVDWTGGVVHMRGTRRLDMERQRRAVA